MSLYFCEITNNFLRKNENVVAESALKDMINFIQINTNYFATFLKNLALYCHVNVAKKDLAAAKVKAEESNKRAIKAEKSLEDWNKYFNDYCLSASRKNEESNKRAAKAEKALEDWKKAYNDLSKKAEGSGKRAEKALKDMKIASKAIGLWGIGKALQDFEYVVARA